MIILGTNVRHRERMPAKGPAILAANHNSHLDTLLLMNMYPLRQLHHIRPVAAADYFLKNPFTAWFSSTLIGILPLERSPKKGSDPLTSVEMALKENNIVILFPEGSRGEPEKRGKLKTGIAHLMERLPDIPVIPIYLHGLGKALPKGDWLPIPFFADVFIGEPLAWKGQRAATMEALEQAFTTTAAEGHFALWE